MHEAQQSPDQHTTMNPVIEADEPGVPFLQEAHEGPAITAHESGAEQELISSAFALRAGAPAVGEAIQDAKVGLRLAAFSKAQGLSMAAIARSSNIPYSIVYRFLRGQSFPAQTIVEALVGELTSDPEQALLLQEAYRTEKANANEELQQVRAGLSTPSASSEDNGDSEGRRFPTRAMLSKVQSALAERGIDIQDLIPQSSRVQLRALPLLLDMRLSNTAIAEQLGTTTSEVSVISHRAMRNILAALPPEIAEEVSPVRSQPEDAAARLGTIGPSLEAICQQAGITRKEILSAISGLTQSRLSRFFSGRTLPVPPALLEPLIDLLTERDLIEPHVAARFIETYIDERRSRKLGLAPAPPTQIPWEQAEAVLLDGVPDEGTLTTEQLGPRIRSLVIEYGVPVGQLAKRLQVTPTALNRFFAGAQSSDRKMVRELLHVLQVDPDIAQRVLDAYRRPHTPLRPEAPRPLPAPQAVINLPWPPEYRRGILEALHDEGIDVAMLQPPDTPGLPLRRAIPFLLDTSLDNTAIAEALEILPSSIPYIIAKLLSNSINSGIVPHAVDWTPGSLGAFSGRQTRAKPRYIYETMPGEDQLPRALTDANAILEAAGISVISLLPPRASRLRGVIPLLLDERLTNEHIGERIGVRPGVVQGMRARTLAFILRNAPRSIVAQLPRQYQQLRLRAGE